MPHAVPRIVLASLLALSTQLWPDSQAAAVDCGEEVNVKCNKISADLIRCKQDPAVGNRLQIKVPITDPLGQDIRCDYCVTSWSNDESRKVGLEFKAKIGADPCQNPDVAPAKMVVDEDHLTARSIQSNGNGGQVVPPSGSPGTATCNISLDEFSGDFTVTGSYSGLSGPPVSAHIHGLAGPGTNAPIILSLSTSGGSSGTFSGAGTLTAAQESGMLLSQTYFDLHTSSFTNGEVRAQINVVLAPAASRAGIALAAIALGGIGVIILARRRAVRAERSAAVS